MKSDPSLPGDFINTEKIQSTSILWRSSLIEQPRTALCQPLLLQNFKGDGSTDEVTCCQVWWSSSIPQDLHRCTGENRLLQGCSELHLCAVAPVHSRYTYAKEEWIDVIKNPRSLTVSCSSKTIFSSWFFFTRFLLKGKIKQPHPPRCSDNEIRWSELSFNLWCGSPCRLHYKLSSSQSPAGNRPDICLFTPLTDVFRL